MLALNRQSHGTKHIFLLLLANDVFIKEISTAMTYQDGMDTCLIDGLRLCSSMEICRDSKHVSGGSVRSNHWAPVADYYNRWISTGK